VVLGLGIRLALDRKGELLNNATDAEILHLKKHGHTGAGRYPPNTNGPLHASGHAQTKNGLTELNVAFRPGQEELMAYAGSCTVEGAKLQAPQAGNDPRGQKLIPRTYLSQRYFSSDEFSAEVEMTLGDLESDFPVEENAQHFGELAFRFKDLQISVFAID